MLLASARPTMRRYTTSSARRSTTAPNCVSNIGMARREKIFAKEVEEKKTSTR